MNARGWSRAAGVATLALIGCTSAPPAARLNAPPQGVTGDPPALADAFTSMSDNAMTHDMTVADLHFIPHSSEISGTGVVRLTRLTPHLNHYGGIVRYETFEKDQALVDMRLEHVREFLVDAGCDMSRVEVKAMISGGRGIRASDAIRQMEKGTAPPADGQGGAGMTGGASASAGG
ncbi:MAG: hypothetical protein KJ057_07165 [Phycisphaerae bacterium]|nr:MAG: hypothetical protein F9K17_13185 [Phycisphaerae bacterium]MBE7457071.1 hypothetical protein [Planctomycetia bacterium]MCK6463571.1 hypothetical protein [Phycisphaerae bacterium]MCL4718239.1 hypothetical protein [Phycisphaerae bacterium]NUQ07841.1 hypothetical protein [Phycisphaerae bacterium]